MKTITNRTIVPVILAGGSGTRLWPLSRELTPKQLLPLIGGKTLLQATLERLPSGLADPIVICNHEHRFMTAEQLRTIGVKPSAIILEPVGRNTSPAVAVAALKIFADDPDALMLVLPADHHVADAQALHEAIWTASYFADQGRHVTFGVVPTCPETGYGYIRKGEPLSGGGFEAFTIGEFVEKPERSRAEEYLRSGSYLWNSGMFLFGVRSILEDMCRLASPTTEACKASLESGAADLDFFRLDSEAFGRCPSESIDCALMEKTELGAVVPLSCGWSDIGSWKAFREASVPDEYGNVLSGDVVIHDSKGCCIHASGRMVAALGLENLVIIETSDAVLVVPSDRAQDVKVLVQKLKAGGRPEIINHKKVYRPWGFYETVDIEDRFQVKRITVNPGARLSLQRHHHRAEHWVVVQGTALVTRGTEELLLSENESTYIPLGFDHRLENPGKIPLQLIEIQSGSYLGEDDIVRLEDLYGRMT